MKRHQSRQVFVEGWNDALCPTPSSYSVTRAASVLRTGKDKDKLGVCSVSVFLEENVNESVSTPIGHNRTSPVPNENPYTCKYVTNL